MKYFSNDNYLFILISSVEENIRYLFENLCKLKIITLRLLRSKYNNLNTHYINNRLEYLEIYLNDLTWSIRIPSPNQRECFDAITNVLTEQCSMFSASHRRHADEHCSVIFNTLQSNSRKWLGVWWNQR